MKLTIVAAIATLSFYLPQTFANENWCQHFYNGYSKKNDQQTRMKDELLQVGVQIFTSPIYKIGTVRHVVLFRYRPDISIEQKEEIRSRFLNLKNLAKRNGETYIVSIETSAQNSGEGADRGLEHGFIVTFKSQGDRNFYVGQPIVQDNHFFDWVHQEFKDYVGPMLDKEGVIVFDIIAN